MTQPLDADVFADGENLRSDTEPKNSKEGINMKRNLSVLFFILLLFLNMNVLLSSNLSMSEIIRMQPEPLPTLSSHPTWWEQTWYVYCGIGKGGCYECRCVEGGWYHMCEPGATWNCCFNGPCNVF